jgi:hypothetical protein
MWSITCPNPECGFKGTLEQYGPSCADECTCPYCGEFFQWEEPYDGDDEDEDEDEDEEDTVSED